MLGLLRYDSVTWFQGSLLQGFDEEQTEIAALIEERNAARKNRKFEVADAIRKSLLSDGIVLEDRPDGTTIWRREQ